MGEGGSATLTPMHLRKAKLMFFWVRYPSSAIIKMYFPDIKFNKNNTAQLVKWFSNFRYVENCFYFGCYFLYFGIRTLDLCSNSLPGQPSISATFVSLMFDVFSLSRIFLLCRRHNSARKKIRKKLNKPRLRFSWKKPQISIKI